MSSNLLAQAITADGYGDPELVIHEVTYANDEAGELGDPIARIDLAAYDITGQGDYDWDSALIDLGYRVIGEWDVTDYGGGATVEPLSTDPIREEHR